LACRYHFAWHFRWERWRRYFSRDRRREREWPGGYGQPGGREHGVCPPVFRWGETGRASRDRASRRRRAGRGPGCGPPSFGPPGDGRGGAALVGPPLLPPPGPPPPGAPAPPPPPGGCFGGGRGLPGGGAPAPPPAFWGPEKPRRIARGRKATRRPFRAGIAG